ncbi:MAG TPA: hypothetical protein VGB15_07280 [Longimicrobium sp.]|jgi:hypothetical protein
MRSCFIPLRALSLVTLTLGVALLTPDPAAAQQCTNPVAIPNGTQQIGQWNAQFASATGCIFMSSQSIYLTGGWVLISPPGSQKPNTTVPPVKVSTSYVPAGASSGQGPVIRSSGGGNSTLPTYLVIAFQWGTSVALLSGSMGSPALNPGCQVIYTSPNQNPAPTPTYYDQNTINILGVLQITNYPTSCP